MNNEGPKSKNLSEDRGRIGREERARILGHGGVCLWFTGLSGSGKSTLARAVEERLAARGVLAYVLDGDNVRMGLNRDLGFEAEDRTENIRRVSEVAALFADAGLVVLCAFISPYRADRNFARSRMPGRFIEIHVDPGLEVCEERDPKGLYQKARAGLIDEFTGISAPFEPPESPDLHLDTASLGVDEAVDCIVAVLEGRQVLSASRQPS